MALATLHAYFLSAAPYVAAGALFIALLAVVYAGLLERRLRQLAPGPVGSLEETLRLLSRDAQELKRFRAELEEYLKLAELRMRGSLQGLGVVRFNPFSGGTTGGNQSFALALLDEEGHGMVLSSLYARDRASVYAKPVAAWASTHELTQEEREAISKARAQIAGRRKK